MDDPGARALEQTGPLHDDQEAAFADQFVQITDIAAIEDVEGAGLGIAGMMRKRNGVLGNLPFRDFVAMA